MESKEESQGLELQEPTGGLARTTRAHRRRWRLVAVSIAGKGPQHVGLEQTVSLEPGDVKSQAASEKLTVVNIIFKQENNFQLRKM